MQCFSAVPIKRTTPGNPLFNISFEDIDLAVPQGTKPFTALQLSHIDGLRLHNVRFFEWDKPNEPSPLDIKLTAIENGVYERCLPTPAHNPAGAVQTGSEGKDPKKKLGTNP